MDTKFTPEFIVKQREIIDAATDGKWLIGKKQELYRDWGPDGYDDEGWSYRTVYDRDLGVFVKMAIDIDDQTEIDYQTIAVPWFDDDAEAIAEAHNNYPAALDEVERLQKEVESWRKMAKEYEARLIEENLL